MLFNMRSIDVNMVVFFRFFDIVFWIVAKNDLILFTADQVHQSGLNSTKNKFRKKFNMNCGSGKIFKEIFLPEN